MSRRGSGFGLRRAEGTENPIGIADHVRARTSEVVEKPRAQVDVARITAHALVNDSGFGGFSLIRNGNCVATVSTAIPDFMTNCNNEIVIAIMTATSASARMEPSKNRTTAFNVLSFHQPVLFPFVGTPVVLPFMWKDVIEFVTMMPVMMSRGRDGNVGVVRNGGVHTIAV